MLPTQHPALGETSVGAGRCRFAPPPPGGPHERTIAGAGYGLICPGRGCWDELVEGFTMLTKARMAIVAVIVLGTLSTSLARNDSGPPTIDIQKICRENVNALRTVLGGEIGQDISVCLMDEQDARARPYKSEPSKTWIKVKNPEAPGT